MSSSFIAAGACAHLEDEDNLTYSSTITTPSLEFDIHLAAVKKYRLRAGVHDLQLRIHKTDR